MTTAGASTHFIDSIFARLIALGIAVLFGAIIFVNWSHNIGELVAGDSEAIPLITEQQPVKAVNAALQICLDQRVGDVEKMKSEGVINDAQYASFRQRAEELCRAQNPI